MSNDTGGASAAAGASSSGLGRGLEGILGDALSEQRAPEVASLLGVAAVRRAPEVRKLVMEMALQSLAETFDTLGVMLVRRQSDQPTAAVRSRIPNEWSIDEPIGFEVAGRLWLALEDRAHRPTRSDVAGHALLVTRHEAGDAVVAAAMLRRQPFDDTELQTVDRLLRSVSASLDDTAVVPDDVHLDVTVGETQRELGAPAKAFTAVVALTPDERPSDATVATATAPSAGEAVAQAALELCPADLELRFTGSSVLSGHRIDLVVLAESGGGPLFGLAISSPDAVGGPAEAVMGAASVVGAGPFGPRPR